MNKLKQLTDELSSKICRLLDTAAPNSTLYMTIKDKEIDCKIKLNGFPLFSLLIAKAAVQYISDFGDQLEEIQENLPVEFAIKWTKLEDKVLIINTLDVDDTIANILKQDL